MQKAAADVDHVDLTPEAAEQAKSAKPSADGAIVFPLTVTGTRDDVLQAAKDLREELKVGEVTDGVQPYVVGQQGLWAGMQELQQEDLEKAETSGFPAILIVLLAVFGSVLAALLPVGLGVAAVIITGAAVFFLSLAITMSVFVTNVASMLGIGVAVDYSLFVLSRYREELRGGKSKDESLDVAMRTSGATVVFSGITVIVSLAGLFLINSTVMRSLAIGAIVVVAIAIVGAVTLLPALIALLGDRADTRGQDRHGHRDAAAAHQAQEGGPAGRADLLGTLVERGHEALGRSRPVWPPSCCSRSPSPRSRSSSATARCASSRETHETRVGTQLASKIVPAGESAPTLIIANFNCRDRRPGQPDRAAELHRRAEGHAGRRPRRRRRRLRPTARPR